MVVISIHAVRPSLRKTSCGFERPTSLAYMYGFCAHWRLRRSTCICSMEMSALLSASLQRSRIFANMLVARRHPELAAVWMADGFLSQDSVDDIYAFKRCTLYRVSSTL